MIDAHQIPGLQTKSRFHIFRLIFAGLAAWAAWGMLSDTKKEAIKQPVAVYQSLEHALSSGLPRYEYRDITIKERVVLHDGLFLGHLRDDAEALVDGSREVGYVVAGGVYNLQGRKVGSLVSGAAAYGVRSPLSNEWGTLDKAALRSLDGRILATLGPRRAVIMDSATITGIVQGYDFSQNDLRTR